MEDNPKKNYYAVIPAPVRYDERLRPNEKLLYGEITALCNERGYCWAKNSYFANLYKVENETISRWISDLKKYGYISTEVIYTENKEISDRYITIKQDKVNTSDVGDNTPLTKKSIGIDEKVNRVLTKKSIGIDEKVKDNITSINNTVSNITSNKKSVKLGLNIPPTLEEVRDYCIENGKHINPESFIAFYESKGWMVGKNKMKNWVAAITTWENREKGGNKTEADKHQEYLDRWKNA